jgi:predicted Fe-Mo cluster-binding NifX family protein
MNFKLYSNEGAMSSGGAGIEAAQLVAKTEVKTVVTGNMGPNAFKTLSAAGIIVYTGADGTVKEAIEKYKKGELKKIGSANVGSHFGMKATGPGFGGG